MSMEHVPLCKSTIIYQNTNGIVSPFALPKYRECMCEAMPMLPALFKECSSVTHCRKPIFVPDGDILVPYSSIVSCKWCKSYCPESLTRSKLGTQAILRNMSFIMKCSLQNLALIHGIYVFGYWKHFS